MPQPDRIRLSRGGPVGTGGGFERERRTGFRSSIVIEASLGVNRINPVPRGVVTHVCLAEAHGSGLDASVSGVDGVRSSLQYESVAAAHEHLLGRSTPRAGTATANQALNHIDSCQTAVFADPFAPTTRVGVVNRGREVTSHLRQTLGLRAVQQPRHVEHGLHRVAERDRLDDEALDVDVAQHKHLHNAFFALSVQEPRRHQRRDGVAAAEVGELRQMHRVHDVVPEFLACAGARERPGGGRRWTKGNATSAQADTRRSPVHFLAGVQVFCLPRSPIKLPISILFLLAAGVGNSLSLTACGVFAAARPTQCRTFPWWPQHLVSDYDWQLAAADCEGIHVTEEEKEGEDIPVYSFDDVMPETILHDIHRSGENYTYDELQQMLSDLREVEPEFVAQYKAEFFAKFSRRVVFSDDEVTVLDSLFDGSSKPTRSFVFNNRLRLTQSEVALVSMPDENSESEPEFDRSTLTLDVHRALCMPLAWLPRRDLWPLPLRVAVLGAGACALPLFILEHYASEELGRLDAVEPSSQVNAVAKRFFGVGAALKHDPRLVIHEEMGEEFLAKQKQGSEFDMVVLDVEAGDGCNGVRAPPLAMLESSFLYTAKRLLTSHGILAVNVNN
ncbi:hypothetical protein ON010_g11070 [Phytophthora cinnamomi]|nr:hypothetical protein ON010_g11070 [Phytophthora cinnamomi]